MLSFTGSLRVFVAVEPCDLRRSFDGLYTLAEQLGEDPRSGALFVFCNRRRDRLKILYFDGSGQWCAWNREPSGGLAAPTRKARSCGWLPRPWRCSPTASSCGTEEKERGMRISGSIDPGLC